MLLLKSTLAIHKDHERKRVFLVLEEQINNKRPRDTGLKTSTHI